MSSAGNGPAVADRVRMRFITMCVAFTIVSACAGDSALDEGSFLDDMKSDGVRDVDVHSYVADAIVDFLNHASPGVLANDVGLGDRVADALVAARSAHAFTTLFDVDRAPYTEQTFFIKTLDWVLAHEPIGSCGDGVVQPSVEVCDGTAVCTGCRLDSGVELGRFAHGSAPVFESAPLPSGGVALLVLAPGRVTVQQLSADGHLVAQTALATTITSLDAHLEPALGGKLGVSFVSSDVNVAGHEYECPAVDDSCGFVFTVNPDGSIEAGRPVDDFAATSPLMLPLPSGDWAMVVSEQYQTLVALLDGATLVTVWQHVYAAHQPGIGPYLDGSNICSVIAPDPGFTSTRSLTCSTPAGAPQVNLAVSARTGEKLAAGPAGVVAFSAERIRALRSESPLPVPFATLPARHVAPLADGRLVVTSTDRVTMIDASGHVAWEKPIIDVRGVSVTQAGVAVRTPTETVLLAL